MDRRYIAIFDSGLGSISVIKALQTLMNENILYLADKKHHPYGTKDLKVLKYIINNTISYLSKYDPKIIIVGSVTPSITILNDIRLYTPMPIFGIYLPLEESVKLSTNITIIGTKGLINSNMLSELLKPYITKASFKMINATDIIRGIENNDPNIDNLIDGLKIDTDLAILASTHLSLIKDRFERIHKGIKFIDGIDDSIKQVKSYLYNRDMLSDESSIRVLVSANLRSFKDIISNIIDIKKIEEIELSF